jgi:hypothetical protein
VDEHQFSALEDRRILVVVVFNHPSCFLQEYFSSYLLTLSLVLKNLRSVPIAARTVLYQ